MSLPVTIILYVVCFILGGIATNLFNIFKATKRIQTARDEKYGELKKIYDITNIRMKTTTNELKGLVEWVNTDLPKDITLEIVSDHRLTILKNKGGIPDKDYIEAFEGPILGIQASVASRVQVALDNINKQFVDDLRGLTNVIQEK